MQPGILLALLPVLLGSSTRAIAHDPFSVDTKDYATFNEAVEAMGSAVGTLGVTGTAKVPSDVTVGSHITLAFLNGGRLEMDEGVHLAINGPVDALPQQIFAGGDRVSFGDGRVAEVYPQWWGAVGDGKTDDTEAIQRMVVTAAGAEMLCRFPQGHYRITEPIIMEASHGLQWRMPPGARIDAYHDDPENRYALVLLNCVYVDMEIRLHVEHKGQGGILVHGGAGRNSCCNKIRGQIQGPGRTEKKPGIEEGSIGLRLTKTGSTNFFNDFNLRIFAFDTAISLQDGCNGNRFLNLQLEKFWYGIQLSSDENLVLGGFCHFAPGNESGEVDCVYVGYDMEDNPNHGEHADASYNQVIGLTCETGPGSRALNIQRAGSNVFMIQNNNPLADIITRPDNHILFRDRAFSPFTEITDGLQISTRETRGAEIELHLSETRDVSFSKPNSVPGSRDVVIDMEHAEPGDTVLFAPGNPIPDGCQVTAWVEQPGMIKTRLLQVTGTAAAYDAGTCRFDLWKHHVDQD